MVRYTSSPAVLLRWVASTPARDGSCSLTHHSVGLGLRCSASKPVVCLPGPPPDEQGAGTGEPGLVLGKATVRKMCMWAKADGWGSRAHLRAYGSDDIVLLDPLSQVKAAEEKGAQVDSLEVALKHHLRHGSAHGRGLLESMATEARGKVHVDD